MRLIVFVLATLLAVTSAFAQMQHPTSPPRLNQKKRNVARQANPAKKKNLPAKPARPAATPVAKPAPAPTPAAPAAAAPVTTGKSIWEEHLQIRLFSEVIGPNLTNSDGEWAYPDANDPNGNYVPANDPISSWNQISFRWKVSDKYHVFINPRWSTHLASTKRIRRANEAAAAAGDKQVDDGMNRWEDWLIGFQGTAWKSDSSGWSVFIRPGYRIPLRRETRNAGWMGELELFYSVDWAGASPWGYGVWHQIRYYVPSFEDPLRLDFSKSEGSSQNVRHRHYIAPYLTYKFTDDVKLEIYYENQLNHNYAAKGSGHGFFSYPRRQRWQQTANVGVSFPVNPSLSLYPFIRAYQLGTIDYETLGYGMWIMGAIY